jgi:hypothetical protein
MNPSPIQTPSASASPPRNLSGEGGSKTLLIASVVFLAVAGASFAFLRLSSSDAKLSLSQPNIERGADTDPTGSGNLKAASSAEVQRDCLLENVGSVGCIYLYQSHLNIGLLADAVENQTYTKQHAAEILATTATLVQTVDGQMEKLASVGLEKEEMDSINLVRDISKLLKAQTDHLQKHWQTGDKSALDAFQQARQNSWKELRSILGLSENAGNGN